MPSMATSRRTFDVQEAVTLAATGLSNVAIGRILGVDESRIRAAFRDVGFNRSRIPTDLQDRFLIEVDHPIVVTEDCGITADFHIPLYDPKYVNDMIETYTQAGIKTLIIGGDFLNMDELSRFEDKQEDANLEFELDEAVSVMGVLTDTFERIIYLWGNHDARLHKTLGYKLQFKNTMKMVFRELGPKALPKIEFTNLDHCWVNQTGNAEDAWYICHPAVYTRTPLTTARTLSAKFNSHVLTAHSHHCAVGYATDGVHVVAEIGGLFDKEKTAYLQRSTTNPVWQQGYALLTDGKLRVYSPGWSLA